MLYIRVLLLTTPMGSPETENELLQAGVTKILKLYVTEKNFH